MKTVAVLAVIALCAFAFKPPKLVKHDITVHDMKQIRDDPSDEPEWFTPKDLPCAFTLDYKSYSGDTEYLKGTIVIGGNHSSMTYKQDYSGTVINYKEIIRADIRDDDNICFVEAVSGKYQGQEVYICQYAFVDPEYSTADPLVLREYLTSAWPYDTKTENYKWTNDITCTRYQCLEKCGSWNYDFCVDNNDHLAGYDNGSYKWIFYNYKMVAYEDNFVVSKKYEGCENEKKIYMDPEPVPADCEINGGPSSSSSVPRFTPKDLPCAFSVVFKEYDDYDDEEESLKGYIYIAGNHSSMTYKSDYGSTSYKAKAIVRADIKDDDEILFALGYCHQYDLGDEYCYCSYDFFDPEYSSNVVTEVRDGLVGSWPYDEDKVTKDYEWTNDLTCTRYRCVDNCRDELEFCVKDDRVVGFIDDGTKWAFSNFEKGALEEDFTLSRKYEGCSRVKLVYEEPRPVPRDCEFGLDSSSESLASTTTIFFSMVFSMVMVVLLF